jgi:hypothetical protein
MPSFTVDWLSIVSKLFGVGGKRSLLDLKIKKSRQTYGNIREMKALVVQIVVRMDTRLHLAVGADTDSTESKLWMVTLPIFYVKMTLDVICL